MIDDKTLSKLKKYLLEILDEFVSICEENNLTYFLIAGTLLGAVRHKGFIPWDDDIDVAMPRKDYEKFLDIFPHLNRNNYYTLSNRKPVNSFCYYFSFAKLCKTETVYAEIYRENENDYSGIFIDIFPFDNCIPFLFPIHSRLIKFAKKIYLIKVKKTTKKNIKYYISKMISIFITTRFSKRLWDKSYTIFNKLNTKYISIFAGQIKNKSDIYNSQIIYPLSSILFEKKYYIAPNNCDYFLKTRYDDYMKLPPINERIIQKPLYIIFGDE